MTITINGTTGITNDGGYTGDGVSFADTTPANTLVTTTGGNVGIGTSSPSYKLDVQGSVGVTISSKTAEFNAAGGSIYSSYNDGTKTWRVGAGIQTAGMFSIRNQTDAIGAVNIDSSGNLLVGTTSGSGRIRMKQSADAHSNTFTIENFGNTNAWSFLIGSDNNLYLGYNGSSKANINNSSGAYSAMSDARLKEQVQASQKGLAEVMALRPVSYVFKDDAEETPQLGLIAQEVEPLIPEVVSAPSSSNQYYGLNYAGVVPVLVKAIQEQQALIASQSEIINAQQAALTALTARVEALEGTQP